VKIILLGLTHELQWKDTSGDLRKLLDDYLASHPIDLIAEEASGLPTTVAQRLAFKNDKPWLEIDMSIADRKLAKIYKKLSLRRSAPLNLGENLDFRIEYLPREDGIRETEWVRRIRRQRVGVVLCLCGLLHVEPFAKKLEEEGCTVEQRNVTELDWFRNLYGTCNIVEDQGIRWCEVRKLMDE